MSDNVSSAVDALNRNALVENAEDPRKATSLDNHVSVMFTEDVETFHEAELVVKGILGGTLGQMENMSGEGDSKLTALVHLAAN